MMFMKEPYQNERKRVAQVAFTHFTASLVELSFCHLAGKKA